MSFLDNLANDARATLRTPRAVAGDTAQPFRDAVAKFTGAPAEGAPAGPPRTGPEVARDVAKGVQSAIGGVLGVINAPVELLNTGFATLTNSIAAVFPALPAATMGSLYVGPPHAHSHPPSLIPPAPPVPLPSLGSIMLGTYLKVLIGGMPAARAGDIGMALTCVGLVPMFEVFLGSSKVFIGGNRAARMGDICRECQPSGAGAARGLVGALTKAMKVAGNVATAAGVAGDAIDAATNADAAMASAAALSAGMNAAQAAADAAAQAISAAMGTDPAIPPAPGAIILGNFNVLIGGFPVPNFPNPLMALLGKIDKMRAKRTAARAAAGQGNCGA